MRKKQKPKIGYEPKQKTKNNKERQYLSGLFTPFGKKIPIGERILKFIIYIALRMVIRPKKWKKPEKNFEIIDRAYKSITSSNFIFIPSSIAYYLLVAFIPLVTIISLLTNVPFLKDEGIQDHLNEVFDGFIPGMDTMFKSLSLSVTKFSASAFTGFITLLITSLWISSSGFSQLIYTQSHLYNHKYVGGYWMNKLKGIFIVIIFSLGLFIALLINYFFVREIHNISSAELSEHHKSIIIKAFLYVGIISLIFFAYIALFKLSPRYKIKVRHVIPGAMTATVPTIIFIVVFGLVSDNLSYAKFGYVGTFLYVGLLVLTISYFTMLGLIVNVSYYNTFVNKPLKKKMTLSRK